MRVRYWFAVTFTACFAALPLSAATSVFGPKAYVLGTGKPQTFSDSFAIDTTASCDGKALYLLEVQNQGVASATISVNGAPLAVESDFQAPAVAFERQLSVGAMNTLTVELKGGRSGASLVISIRRQIEEHVSPPVALAVTAGRTVLQRSLDVLDPMSHFSIIAQNGDGDGNRVNTATVRVNGLTVIGDNDLNRSIALVRKPLSLELHNTIDVELTGPTGSTISIAFHRQLDESACGPHVTFDSPAEHAAITTAGVLVQGTVAGGRDVGVTINGVRADIDLSPTGTATDPFHWLATVIPDAGPVTLHAVATNAGGGKGETSRPITFAPAPNAFTFRADPASGVAPLSAEFNMSLPDSMAIVRYEFDLDGDGTYETSSLSYPDSLHLTYPIPGIRIASARLTTNDGAVLTASAPVVVQSFAVMDGLLRQQWNSFTAALVARDVDKALALLADVEVQEKYKPALELIRPTLPDFAAGLGSIEPMWITANAAHYLLVRTEDGRRHGYHMYLLRDANGHWKIAQF